MWRAVGTVPGLKKEDKKKTWEKERKEERGGEGERERERERREDVKM